MALVQIDWKPDAGGLRKFGFTMIVGFALIGGAFFYFGKITPAYVCWGFGGVAGLLGLTGTKVALPIYWLWMGVAFVMGNIMSRIILGAIYFGMFMPMGLFMRLIGRDKLQLKGSSVDTYWSDVPSSGVEAEDKSRYERQF